MDYATSCRPFSLAILSTASAMLATICCSMTLLVNAHADNGLHTLNSLVAQGITQFNKTEV